MQFDACILFAHGGAKLDPKIATVIGIASMAVGGWMLVRELVAWFTKGRFGGGAFSGIFLLLFGYVFLAGAQNLPGGAIAGQLLLWWFVLPLLFLPWFFWRLRQYQRREQATRDQDCTNHDLSGEDRIRQVLRPDEKILWCGVPAPRRFRSEKIAYFVFGMIPFLFSTVFLTFVVIGIIRNGGVGFAELPGYLIGLVAGLGFFTLSIGCFLYPWKMASRLKDVTYALTDQRAIVLTSPKLLWNPVPARNLGDSSIDFAPDQIRQYKKKWRDFGRVDLIFLQEWRGSRRKSQYVYGFLGLDDPDEPERLIKEFYLGPQHTKPGECL